MRGPECDAVAAASAAVGVAAVAAAAAASVAFVSAGFVLAVHGPRRVSPGFCRSMAPSPLSGVPTLSGQAWPVSHSSLVLLTAGKIVDASFVPPGRTTKVAVSDPTSSSLSVSWTSAAGSSPLMYEVEAVPAPLAGAGGPGAAAGTTTQKSAAGATSMTVTGLCSNTRYAIRVRAVVAGTACVGPWSDDVAPATTVCTAPDAPNAPRVKNTTTTAAAAAAGSLHVEWDGVAAGTEGVAGYDLQYRVSGAAAAGDWALVSVAHPGTACDVTGLATSATYELRVRCHSSAAGRTASDWSAIVSIATVPPPVSGVSTVPWRRFAVRCGCVPAGHPCVLHACVCVCVAVAVARRAACDASVCWCRVGRLASASPMASEARRAASSRRLVCSHTSTAWR